MSPETYSDSNSQKSYYLEPEQPSKTQQALKKTSGFIINALQIIAVLGFVGIFLYLFVFPFNIVDGASMQPNFCNKDLYVTYKLDSFFKPYEREDVIAFKHDEKSNYIKRVIGIPGDRIRIEDGKVYRNGMLLNEVYLPEGRQTEIFAGDSVVEGQELVVPKNKYFVMGDNRPNSQDSRYFGVIDQTVNAINGKVVLVLWPPQRFRVFDKYKVFPADECTVHK